MPAELLRLKRLTIEELFGPGSGTIDIPFRMEERVTVLHGRNGSGKTITLGLLAALKEGRFGEFLRYPLKRIVVELSDGSTLSLAPAGPPNPFGEEQDWALAPADLVGLRFTSQIPGVEARSGWFMVASSEDGDREWMPRSAVQADFDRDGHVRASVIQPGVIASERVNMRAGRNARRRTGGAVETSDLLRFRKNLPFIKLIRTDRLFLREQIVEPDVGAFAWDPYAQTRLMVEHLGGKIGELVKVADAEYRQRSTRLDASLSQRLFKPQSKAPTREELRARSEALQEKEERLQTLGLLRDASDRQDLTQLSADQLGTLAIILKDREEKLQPFDAVVGKAERILKSLNKKLAPKTVRLDLESGYEVLTAAGEPLPLDCLSSGEQHELVLLHELLFDIPPNSLILIDEPELSLHVTWQQDLLPELMDIAKLANLDFLLATHSPYIIGDHDELMVRLGEPA